MVNSQISWEMDNGGDCIMYCGRRVAGNRICSHSKGGGPHVRGTEETWETDAMAIIQKYIKLEAET